MGKYVHFLLLCVCCVCVVRVLCVCVCVYVHSLGEGKATQDAARHAESCRTTLVPRLRATRGRGAGGRGRGAGPPARRAYGSERDR